MLNEIDVIVHGFWQLDKKCRRLRIEVRPTALQSLLTLALSIALDLDFQSPATYGLDPYTCLTCKI